jgi:hypothetical protein
MVRYSSANLKCICDFDTCYFPNLGELPADPIFLLTSDQLMSIVADMTQMYSTAQVASAIGVSKKTILRWLWSGKLAEPKQTIGAGDSRVWTEADLNRAKRHRERNYRKRS